MRKGIAGIFGLAGRSLRQHALSTCVTVISVGLASGLVMAVSLVADESRRVFTSGPSGFDAVLGARGSQLQLVLNAVYHLDTSPGNIPWALYEQARSDPRVASAIPYVVGDNFAGYRIVGTVAEMFSQVTNEAGKPWAFEGSGKAFDVARREAVLGCTVARKTGLGLGDTFRPVHGLVNDPSLQHEEEYTVVGVLQPTNTSADRVLWIPLEGVFHLSGHVLRGGGEEFVPEAGAQIPDEHKEVSAVLLKFRSPQFGYLFDQMINRQGTTATLAWPIGKSMAEVFDKMGWVTRVLQLVAVLTALVAAGSILASLWNSMNERRREFALYRALGARRRTVFGLIVVEALTIALLGCVLGYGVCFVIMRAAAAIVASETGVILDPFGAHRILMIVPMAMLSLGVLAGLLPAWRAYRTDVARHLVSTN